MVCQTVFKATQIIEVIFHSYLLHVHLLYPNTFAIVYHFRNMALLPLPLLTFSTIIYPLASRSLHLQILGGILGRITDHRVVSQSPLTSTTMKMEMIPQAPLGAGLMMKLSDGLFLSYLTLLL